MKQHITTRAVVLTRINYQEADRIVTLLTPDHGKVRVIAKGVRKSKSKMAGGIELFSVNEITYIPGRGDIATLVSSRLVNYYGDIVKQLDRTMLGYDVLKKMNSATEDAAASEFFETLVEVLEILNTAKELSMIELSFIARLLNLAGNSPALTTAPNGQVLKESSNYSFSYDGMAFMPDEKGVYLTDHIKLMRSAVTWSPRRFCAIQAPDNITAQTLQLLKKIALHN